MYNFKLRYVFIVIIAICLLSGVAFFVWANTVRGPSPEALVALQSDAEVQVTTDQWLVFEPEDGAYNTGFIFYPGGRVEPRSYAPFAHDIAAQGYLVVIVPVRLNLALFDTQVARGVMDAYPQVTHWAVGGHSLGGVAATEFADDNIDIEGLVLWASYPQEDTDLSADEGLVVASIYGTNDLLATVESVEASRLLLPESTIFVPIEGGNHQQFGWYGEQAGDGEPTISREEQQRQIVEATVAVLQQISEQQ
jgi:hypothetical protein